MTTESQIENRLIEKLKELKYTHRTDITDRERLEHNFRKKFEALNQVQLTDAEFSRLLNEMVTADVFNASKVLRERNTFIREDDTPLHYTLVNIKDWCKNEFEVINQLRINTHNSYRRYDVILLMNGIPVVQVELKAMQVSPRRAMEQIVRYKKDRGNGYTNTLLCFIQLFIVSNQTDTYYFANNSDKHFQFNADEQFLPVYRWADKKNQKITHLEAFTRAFLPKCSLGKMISRYMVLIATGQKLLIMRPYQIYAVEAIVDCIDENRGNGYIWHTTGSGKTLTSFKASTLLKDKPEIEKCLFVVDRKDLDRQTRQEFNKFQEGCVEENTNTHTLVQRLLSRDYANKVMVTTIQKLGLALGGKNKKNYKEQLKPLREKRMVFIFDECHRSQFGENHQAIKEFFPKAQLFGFTGTPIFGENATYQQREGTTGSFKTTEDIFENPLHAYTIAHAIEDKNVLRFHIDYFGKKAASSHSHNTRERLETVVREILKKHDAATHERCFNALFAVSSINDAIEYYELFKTIQTEKQEEKQEKEENFQPLNIACVFSPPAEGNKDIKQIQEDLPQEKEDNLKEPKKKKAALTKIITDYNEQYATNHTINNFDLYYQDVQKRIKDQQYPNKDYPRKEKIDIVIVVDMLLTGFDSKYLNTLYVDKNLSYHRLIQAYSRTNRVLNDTKPFGNILDFRGQEDKVDQAIELFSGASVSQPKEIWLVEPAPAVIEKLKKAKSVLDGFMQSQGLACAPEQVANLKGDEAKGEFIHHFKEVQRLKTKLDQYTDLSDEQTQTIAQLLPEDTLPAFKRSYLDLAQDLKKRQDRNNEKESSPLQQTDFELLLFNSVVIDYDYIMGLCSNYTYPDKQKMTKAQISALMASDAKFIDEKEVINAYIDTLEVGTKQRFEEIKQNYDRFKKERYAQELKAIAEKHGLNPDILQAFVKDIMSRMIFDGGDLTDLLTPLNLRWRDRTQKELALMKDLTPLLKKRTKGRGEISGLSAYENL